MQLSFLPFFFQFQLQIWKCTFLCLIESLTDYTGMFLNSMVHGTLQNKISTSERIMLVN